MTNCELCRKAATYGIASCRWHVKRPRYSRAGAPRSGYVGRGSYTNTVEGRHDAYVNALVLRCDDKPECMISGCTCPPL